MRRLSQSAPRTLGASLRLFIGFDTARGVAYMYRYGADIGTRVGGEGWNGPHWVQSHGHTPDIGVAYHVGRSARRSRFNAISRYIGMRNETDRSNADERQNGID